VGQPVLEEQLVERVAEGEAGPLPPVRGGEEETALARRYGATAAVVKGSPAKLKEIVEKLLGE